MERNAMSARYSLESGRVLLARLVMTLTPGQISEGSARSVGGAGIVGSLYDAAVPTTAVSFDLTAWQGRFVIITITGNARYRWAEATGATLDVATEHGTASTASTTGMDIGGLLIGPGAHHKVVPISNRKGNAQVGLVFLRIAAVSGTIDVAVEPG